MELRHLRYFTAVVDCKGYREQPRRLHIAQPSTSEAVSDLERTWAETLFANPSRCAFEAGRRIFYTDAVRILQQAETAILTAKRAAQGKVGRLSIGFIGSATLSFLPDLIRRYDLEYPNVKRALHSILSSRTRHGTEARSISPSHACSRLSASRISNREYCCVTPWLRSSPDHESRRAKRFGVFFEATPALPRRDSVWWSVGG